MVFSQPTLISTKTSHPISGYEKFQKGIFDVSDLKFYMNSADNKTSPINNKERSPSYTNGSQLTPTSESEKVERLSPTSTSRESSSPKVAFPNLLPRFQFTSEEKPDFSPVSTFPEFSIPTGDDLDTISIVNTLKQRMKFEGLSQTKVARSLGKGQATVSQILNLQFQNPKPWAMLTERGKDTYRLLKLWLDQQMLSEEEGQNASYEERLKKLSAVTGLTVDQVQKWVQYHTQETSPHNGSLLSEPPPFTKALDSTETSSLFRESPKNDMLLDLTRIRLKEEDIVDLFKKPPECEATEICTQYAERVNLWIARGNFLSTEEISAEVRREIEKHSISQGMFSQKILRRKQATLSEALCHPKPWGRLSDRGKLIYCFMKLWLLLPDERRLAPFKEESLQRFRQIPSQAIPVLEHEYKIYKGTPPKMVKEKLAEDLGLEYCTVANFFSHIPSSNALFKGDLHFNSCLPTMVKYPSPMETLQSFGKTDFHASLPPLSPMTRVGGLNPLHPLSALHSQQEFQNGLLRSKSFLLETTKDMDTSKIVSDLKNRLRLLNVSLQTFIDSVLVRKYGGTVVGLSELLVQPRSYISLPQHHRDVFVTIQQWLEKPMHEQLASISPLAQRAFKPFDPILYTSMESYDIQNVINETKSFLKQHNISPERFSIILAIRSDALNELLTTNPGILSWSQLSLEQRSICTTLKEWVGDKILQEKIAMFFDSTTTSTTTSNTDRSPSLNSIGLGSSRLSPTLSASTPFFLSSNFLGNTSGSGSGSNNNNTTKLNLPLISSALTTTPPLSFSSQSPLVKSPPTTIIQTSTAISTPAFKTTPSEQDVGSPSKTSSSTTTAAAVSAPAAAPSSTHSPLISSTSSPMEVETFTSKCGSNCVATQSQTDIPDTEPVSVVCYGESTRSIGSQKWPRDECCHEAFQFMLQHVRETSSKNIMLCNHLEQIYKHLVPYKRERTWSTRAQSSETTELENPMKRVKMSSPNS